MMSAEPPVTEERMSCERITGASVAEFLLEEVAHASGPFIGSGMGIPEVENMHWPRRRNPRLDSSSKNDAIA